ncbi:MAG: helix-turn-helix domain-containing protein [Myxococcales bacterium]|nr:helix-turn-helix domain-containing protein [Myxococcales bacterium]
MSRADVLLHPIRIRIVQAVAAAGEATTAAIAETLADVPPATLYRHVGKLLEADVLQVVGSRQARGATERTLAVARARLGADDLEGASREDHERWFLGFLLGLFGKLERQPDGPVVLEGFGYHTHQL